MRFDLTDLKLFLHVVEAGSITAGADRMHLAVAAASTRIRNMEIELGTALLNRDRQGVQPTPAGRTLIHHARLLLQQAERMRGELSEYADGLKGHIRLMSNTNALTEFLPEPLSQFLASHPQVNIDLEERLSDEIVAAVADGQADIGIVAGTEDVTGLEVFAFRVDRFVLVTAAGNPLAAKERIAPVSRSCQGQPPPGPLQVNLHPSVHRYRSPVPAVRELLVHPLPRLRTRQRAHAFAAADHDEQTREGMEQAFGEVLR